MGSFDPIDSGGVNMPGVTFHSGPESSNANGIMTGLAMMRGQVGTGISNEIVGHTASTNGNNTTGTKRKRSFKSDMPKLYAVRVGKAPGIYNTWAECLDQVRGFPKAMFKSFTTKADAESYMKDGRIASSGGYSGNGDGQVTRWYGVQSGKAPGVYTSWQDVLQQITGWKGPKHRGFKTEAEAQAYVAEGRLLNGYGGDGEDGRTAKKSKKGKPAQTSGADDSLLPPGGAYEPGHAPLPEDAEDNFDPTIILDHASGTARYKTQEELQAYKPFATRPTAPSTVRIYTDGSSLGNGQHGACGGVGVYFGPGDKRNLSEALPGTKQTNQRAELTAIQRALEIAPRDRKCIIYSDSQYAIKCVTEWFQKWRQNNWTNSHGKPVENKDLIARIIDALEERWALNRHRVVVDEEDGEGERGHWERGPASVKFEWVRGHDKDLGNNAADRLAVAGAREARELGGVL